MTTPILTRLAHLLRGCNPYYEVLGSRYDEATAEGIWWRCSVCGHEEFG